MPYNYSTSLDVNNLKRTHGSEETRLSEFLFNASQVHFAQHMVMQAAATLLSTDVFSVDLVGPTMINE